MRAAASSVTLSRTASTTRSAAAAALRRAAGTDPCRGARNAGTACGPDHQRGERAAFLPRGSYAAAKAWLLSFSRWAHLAYAARGVTVTAVCPGLTHTEFHERMGMDKAVAPSWAWLSADRVVREGLADNLRGRATSIPSKRYKAVALRRAFCRTGYSPGLRAGRSSGTGQCRTTRCCTSVAARPLPPGSPPLRPRRSPRRVPGSARTGRSVPRAGSSAG